MTRSAQKIGLALSLTLAASACASADGHPNRYDSDLARLEADCRARGGILTPSEFGGQTGRPQTDYVCKIIDAGTRLRN
ncbi:hypothetical protein [Brevundimonas subvibrioides]|uniref:hypothetical protein n=1 Tax=Brevundimonas subvibrioides TaxID=74313 RepID=UPI0022B4D24B|nr:hypothetical protein [Brevundimonas subvibrioides]